MDVQTESTEPPPSESQPSGKIRKGFKLFGKRKPGNIFSLRSKSEGNNKSPLHRSKTLDVPDSAANDSEDQQKEKIEGDEEQAEEGPLGEDGVLAAAPARTSISSASSAKSLGFLSILRGGRRGVGDRRVHTVSQPVGRQRRGIKGLFGNVKFRSKDKEEKEEVPPSPLLMSSRSNSVEIIKEDLTLTPKSQPRSLDSPGTESSEPTNKSLTAQDSSATSPARTVTPGTEPNESHSTTQAAMVPGETSLSTLLADISSLLTFDSISGGGDIMADVEAEWGKASAAVTSTSPSYTSFSRPVSSPISSTFASPKPVNSILTTLPSSTTPSSPSSPMKPSSIITTLTKSTTLTTPTIKPANETATSVTTSATKPSTNISAPIMSSPTITMKTTLGVTATATAPPNTPATATKAPSASPTLTSTVNKLSSETTETPKTVSSTSFVATPPAAMFNLPKTTPFTMSSASKPELTSSFTATSFNKVPVTVSMSYPLTGQVSPLAPLITSKTTTTTQVTSATTSISTSNITSAQFWTADQNKTSTFLVSESSSSTATTFTKTQVSSVSKSQDLPTSATAAPVYLNGTLPTQPSTMSVPSPALTQISKVPSSSFSVSKEGPLSVSQPKISPAPSEMPSFLSKMPTPTSQISASSPQIPFASSTTTSAHPALSQTSSCPVSSTPLPLAGLVRKRESDPCSVDGSLTSPKTPEPREVLQEYSHQVKEDKKRTSQGHGTGLSKIPVVGGGRIGKIPVRVSQSTEEEINKDTTVPAPEESTPHVNSHDGGGKDKIAVSEVAVVTSKHSQEESQTLPKAPASSPRDSKIPVKHGSQIPQANRTKIPVSKVPVRRAAGAKPAAQSGSTQIRK